MRFLVHHIGVVTVLAVGLVLIFPARATAKVMHGVNERSARVFSPIGSTLVANHLRG